MSDRTKNILEWIECILIAVILALLIRYFVGTPTVVQKESMYPTLQQGERLILNRLTRTFNQTPERGQIITFEAPTITSVNPETADLSNPVATYLNEPTNIFSKFTYHVLEWGKTSYLNRVIGLPGDHVKIENGKVYINDQELDESAYLQDDVVTEGNGGAFTDITVPEGYIFAMGDNRENSVDCRSFGCVPIEKLEGTVVLRFWPLDKFGTVGKAE